MTHYVKNFLLAGGLFFSLVCQAQKGDDFIDARRKNESFAKVHEKDIRADIASFTLAGVNESIGKADLTKISFGTFGPNFMTFTGEDIKVSLNTALFDAEKHKLQYDEKYLVKIDKKPYYGAYGSLPKSFVSNISFMIGNDTVAIPAAAYADLYNLNLTYTDKGVQRTANAIYRSKDGHKVYLYLLCKDNTGNYEVTFIILDKKYMRRVLDYDLM